jgi:hypothetical protein
VAFDSSLKLEFQGSKVTSNAGLLTYRELDEALGLAQRGKDTLNDYRTGKNTTTLDSCADATVNLQPTGRLWQRSQMMLRRFKERFRF